MGKVTASSLNSDVYFTRMLYHNLNGLPGKKVRIFSLSVSKPLGVKLIVGVVVLDPTFDENLIKHSSPLAREHINLTGDYIWIPKPYESKLRVE